MTKTIRNIISYLVQKPKTLFLIDSFGALLTAFFLFILLRNFNKYIGLPKEVYTYLAAIAACFCIYSAACYVMLKDNWSPFIKLISIANLLYCLLTMSLLIINYSVLTFIGKAYFILEIAIICGLVYIEFNVVKAIKKSNVI